MIDPDGAPMHPLVDFFGQADVNNISRFASFSAGITEKGLADMFAAQVVAAPRRSRRKKYIVGHTGHTTSGSATNRREEHCAIALWRAYQDAGFVLPDGQVLSPIDYQLPLKASRDPANAGIGKVDLFCRDHDDHPWVAELKVGSSHPGARPDTPLKALLEALAYCAMLDAEKEALSAEVRMKVVRPNVLVLAPASYWDFYEQKPEAGEWQFEMSHLRQRVESAIGIRVDFVTINDCVWEMRGAGTQPELLSTPSFDWALAHDRYLQDLVIRFRRYRDLQSGTKPARFRSGRPRRFSSPVFVEGDERRNIVTQAGLTERVFQELPRAQKHRWFGSMRSSQALALSVFGTLKVTGKLHLLADLPAEDGGLALSGDLRDPSCCHIEHPCRHLGELPNRETRSDVYIVGAHNVSIECKLAEEGFDGCSQPGIEPDKPHYDRDHCDGTYTFQRGRSNRCSLTDKHILYWSRARGIFRWAADTDHIPCPMRTPYQLVRNILAADPGHALLVYDARNPPFIDGGPGDRIFRHLRSALVDPSRLRRCNWQSVISSIERDPELRCFAQELRDKYGFQEPVV